MGSVPSVGNVNSTHVLDVFRSVVAAGAMSSVHSALTHVRGPTETEGGVRGVLMIMHAMVIQTEGADELVETVHIIFFCAVSAS